MHVTYPSSVILDKGIARKIAQELLSIDAVKLNVENPFTWVSGIQSPVYCDNRVINSFVSSRSVVADSFVQVIRNNFPDVDIIAGVATGGIPQGILIAERLNLPFVYVRQAPKGHGTMQQVEGYFKEGANVLLIEDHVSTGGSSLKAVEGLWNAKLNLIALMSIMTYNFKAAIELFRSHDIHHYSLSDLDTVLEIAAEKNLLSQERIESILAFRNDPKSWAQRLNA